MSAPVLPVSSLPPDATDEDHAAPRRRVSRRGGGGITLREVAQLAGVAPITASRALNTPSAVSPRVLQKVREAVQATGYVPNLLAGGLASSKSRLVALVVPTVIGPVFQGIVHTLTESLGAAGYQVMLGQSGYENSREDALLEAIIGRRPDGVVLTGIMRAPEVRQRLLASGIPVVETWDLTPTPIDMVVGFSHEDVGVEVARYLQAAGRRAAAVVGGRDERSQRRMQAFAQEAARLGMTAAGTVPMHAVSAPTTLGQGRSGLADLLARQPDIDAIFCSSDLLALGVMIEAQSRGIVIPDQLAVIGFGDQEFSKDLQPRLTSVHVDDIAIGRHAARFIIDRAAGAEVGPRVVDVGFTIIRRDSA